LPISGAVLQVKIVFITVFGSPWRITSVIVQPGNQSFAAYATSQGDETISTDYPRDKPVVSLPLQPFGDP